MSNGKKPEPPKPQPVARRSIAIVDCVDSDKWKIEIAKMLPQEVMMDAFLRITRTTASADKFNNCDPLSFLNALLKCARAGLPPDGVRAHLIPFGREVQAIFDWKGLVDLAARNSIQVIPKLVCENDEFYVEEDDGTGQTRVIHKWGKGDRGPVVGVYARARLKDGTCDYEYMTADEVESVRQNYSRAKNSEAWTKSWNEMAKKTPIKRLAKRLPMSAELKAAMNADDDSIPFESEPTKVVKPLFRQPPQQLRSPEQAAEEQSQAALNPEEQEEAVARELLAEIQKLCTEHDVSETAVLSALFEVGTAGANYENIEQLVQNEPKAAKQAIESWDAVVAEIQKA